MRIPKLGFTVQASLIIFPAMTRTMQWLLLILSALIILDFTHIFYFNIFTHSLPYGIYMKIEGAPKRGDYAATCLTREISQYGIDRAYLAQGSCETGTVLVLKVVQGIPGDHFIVENGSLKINGHSYPIMGKDSSGRALKLFYDQKAGLLNKGKYILLSDFVKNSWDSRYWGGVSIQFLLKPLWILGHNK
ncbi:MAG: S26 family signal peptidase [Candidatus Omnitrophica bacterium]|nr:S26 family signal peptidase [Candidatus Omnitrophota bacterium]